jgi:hypothetical protein
MPTNGNGEELLIIGGGGKKATCSTWTWGLLLTEAFFNEME